MTHLNKLVRTMGIVAGVAALCIGGSVQPASAAQMIGYWDDWETTTLGTVSNNYDVIDVAFAVGSGTDGASLFFWPGTIPFPQIAIDTKHMTAAGKHISVSVGGSTSPSISLQNATDINTFVTSAESIIDLYGFNGIDIDLEGQSLILNSGDNNPYAPTTPAIVNLITALSQLKSHYGPNFMITAAPECADVDPMRGYGNTWGCYLPLIYGLGSAFNIACIQCYDSSGMYGRDGVLYNLGTPDFDSAMTDLILGGQTSDIGQVFNALPQSQCAFGVPATNGSADGTSYQAPSIVLEIAKYLGSGTSYGGSYRLANPAGYPNFGGVMTWDINDDQAGGSPMANTVAPYLHTIGGWSTGGWTTGGSYPSAPSNLYVTATSSTPLSLAWSAGSGATSYDIYRGTTNATENVTPFATGVTGTSYTDSTVTNGDTYYYVVSGVNASGTSSVSNEQYAISGSPGSSTGGTSTSGTTGSTTGSCSAAPAAPTGLAASNTTSSGTTLNWSAVTPPANCTVTGYTVYKGGTALATVTGTTYAVTGLAASTAYSFTVAAIDSVGTGSQSSAVNVTTLANSCSATPSAPTGLAASNTTSSGTTLNWSAVTPPANCTVTGYTVYKGGTALATVTTTTYAVAGLATSTAYTFTVAAIDSVGTSSQSSAVNVTTLANSCSAAPSAPTGLAASGTTSSGTTLNWSAVTPPANCTVTGYTVYKGGTALATVTTTTYAVTGLSASTAYTFTVAAIDSFGTGAQSAAVNVTTPASGGGGTSGPVSINCGGPAITGFLADTDFVGGSTISTSAAISEHDVWAPLPPQALFQTQRTGTVTYTLNGFTPSSSHMVWLYFAEIQYTAAGQREFNVTINGTQELTNYDIFAASGGANDAIEVGYGVLANAAGQIVIQLTPGAAGVPAIAGLYDN